MPANSSASLFIEPLDVLILRGNKLFADAGSHGEALMPPWPSVAAGALRSRQRLGDEGSRLLRAGRADAAWPDAEIVLAAHGRGPAHRAIAR